MEDELLYDERMRKFSEKSVVVADDQSLLDSKWFCIPSYYEKYIEGVLLTRGMIRDRLEKVAFEIFQHYRKVREDIVLVVTLKGAITLFHELSSALRKISHSCVSSDDAQIERPCYVEQYVVCSSYRGTSQGALLIHADIRKTIERCRGKHVVIVEDLVDTGQTLINLTEDFKRAMKDPNHQLDLDLHRPEKEGDWQKYILSVRSVVGFAKKTKECPHFIPDWIGFTIPNVWIVGFGCDVTNHFRDLDHLAVMNEKGKAHYQALEKKIAADEKQWDLQEEDQHGSIEREVKEKQGEGQKKKEL